MTLFSFTQAKFNWQHVSFKYGFSTLPGFWILNESYWNNFELVNIWLCKPFLSGKWSAGSLTINQGLVEVYWWGQCKRECVSIFSWLTHRRINTYFFLFETSVLLSAIIDIGWFRKQIISLVLAVFFSMLFDWVHALRLIQTLPKLIIMCFYQNWIGSIRNVKKRYNLPAPIFKLWLGRDTFLIWNVKAGDCSLPNYRLFQNWALNVMLILHDFLL